jgi:hypothetical protein
MHKNTSSFFLPVILALFVILFDFSIYTFLHESGHALAGILFCQSITEFNVNFWSLNAHVGLVGGALTPFQLALQSAAGAGVCPLVTGALMVVSPFGIRVDSRT